MEMHGSKGHSHTNDTDFSRGKTLPFKMFICTYCGKKFLNSQALGGHQNAHKKERREDKNLKLHMNSMMMHVGGSFGVPLMPYAIIQLHGAALPAQHQVTSANQPFLSQTSSSSGSNSQHQQCPAWSRSYRQGEGALDYHVPAPGITNCLRGDVYDDDNGASYHESRGLDLELPDLNLDPPK